MAAGAPVSHVDGDVNVGFDSRRSSWGSVDVTSARSSSEGVRQRFRGGSDDSGWCSVLELGEGNEVQIHTELGAS